MSIAAINKALEQKTDGPSAQSVLFIIADRANEHGICRHADPDTIAIQTRQSRATVFRRLEELERAGLITRFTRHLEDGRREYEIRFRLDLFVNYRVRKDRTIELYAWEDDACATCLQEVPYGGAPIEEGGESQIETQGGESQFETQGVSPVRLGESHSCDSQKSPTKNPKEEESPLPPNGGESEAVDREKKKTAVPGAEMWPDFETTWGEPIGRMSIAQQLWSAMTDAERLLAIRAAKGYNVWRSKQKKTPNRESAQTFLRETGAWTAFAAQAPAEGGPASCTYTSRDIEGRAWLALHVIAGVPMPFGFNREPSDQFRVRVPITPAMLACGSLVDERGWVDKQAWHPIEIGTQKAGAWTRFLRECIDRSPCVRELNGIEGFLAPWEWPPLKDGTLSPAPPGEISEQDAADFTK